ncbi:DMT family transporter [Acidithiobacillus ferriphilus]|uniref:DMT family transporter n=1 Tax=Acidithiobacillus ferriphilus TaxID=1689834 RepID=UPI001D004295|nr:EamA family transporter [Acidithiobacillus ferriphilus]MDA8181870.1 EamA family transporter [Acidithiobacillus sp.]
MSLTRKSTERAQVALLPFAALALLSLIWGYNWVVMKVALTDCPPLLFAALRVWGSVLVLIPLMLWMKRPLAMPSARYIIPFGLLQTTGFIGLAMWALEYGGAGKIAILVYMMPIWLIVFAWPILGERLHGLQWPALALALLGLTAILQPWNFSGQWTGSLLALLSGILWAASALWQKRHAPPGLDLLNSTLWQAAFGGLGLTVIALWIDPLEVHWTPLFIGTLLYNVLPGTALAYFLWAYVLQELPSSIAGMGTLAVPLIGVVAAWLQLGEQPSDWEAIGIIGILIALALVSWQHLHPRHGDDILLPTGQE